MCEVLRMEKGTKQSPTEAVVSDLSVDERAGLFQPT